MPIVRIRIDIAYDGSDFSGWARQPSRRTVEGELEAAITTVLRVPSVVLTCAGRTDAGVHARGQVVHLDLDRATLDAARGRSQDSPVDAFARRLNGFLPSDLRVRRVVEPEPGFDARFSALWRRYAYRVADRPGLVDPLTRGHVLVWSSPLDLDAMNVAAGHLLGLRDFAAFCKRRDGATTVRTLLDLRWDRDEAGVAVLNVRADAFCHKMVRSLAGCLLAVGDGREQPAWAGEVMRAAVRDSAVLV
ncbi:MAG: tRNA pseudouridine(38-40) synthase TruA, partial [Nocardioides sp.]|nr:tRNA pseudouridine(38-40) synthase TruA [Nocardioides sp.]